MLCDYLPCHGTTRVRRTGRSPGVVDAFGQFLALGGEQLQAFLRVACGLVVIREQGVHERGADDDAVRVGADLGACSAVDTPMPTHTFSAPA